MKTVPAAMVSVMLIVIMITPVFAEGPVVLQGDDGGSPPVILGIWEQDLSGVLEDGDSIHSYRGAQFLPPCNGEERKTVQFYAMVTDRNGPGLKAVNGEIQQINGSYHETIPLMRVSETDGIGAAEMSGAANLIHYSIGFSGKDVMTALRNGTASVWKGELTFPSTLNAGIFTVSVTGTDTLDQYSVSLKNSFAYHPVACIEYDFTSVNYGSAGLGTDKWVLGDDVFGTGDKPTVRNTGNVPARIRLTQDDMDFGQDMQGAWNVKYNARMGTSDNTSLYSPGDNVLISEVVSQGSIEPMDFSIQVFRGTGSHAGSMILGYDSLPSEQPGNDELPGLLVPEFPGIKEFMESIMQIIDLD